MSMTQVFERLLGYGPAMYLGSALWQEILTGEAQELDGWQARIEELGRQLFVDTATWGLDYYENELGIPTNPADSHELRRSRIKAKLKGGGTMTPARLLDVVLTYVDEARVTYDVANNLFEIRILLPHGVPSLDAELRKAVEGIRPAHLGFDVIYTYLTWSEKALRTWGQEAGKTWGEMAVSN